MTMEARNADLSTLRIDRTVTPAQNPQRPKTRYAVWAAVGVIALGAAAFAVWRSFLDPAMEVRLVAATWTSPSQSNAVLTASGYVVAQRRASVASKGMGRLVYLGVVEGDKVKKDQIVARLEDSDIAASLDQARATLRVNEADLKDVQRTLDRVKSLFKMGLSTQAELDAAEARYQRVIAGIAVAKASVAGAEVSLENTRIRAPFDGTVLTKNADVGEVVAPLAASASSRAAVVTIADMSSLEVEADVSESNIEHIGADQPCEITLDAYPSVRYRGYVNKIVPTADRAKATVMVKVGFRTYDGRVLPEMSAKVLFLSIALDSASDSLHPALTVPSTAVVERAGRVVVFTVNGDRASERLVTTGARMGALVEIKSGLQQGDRVIEKVDERVRDGTKVKIP